MICCLSVQLLILIFFPQSKDKLCCHTAFLCLTVGIWKQHKHAKVQPFSPSACPHRYSLFCFISVDLWLGLCRLGLWFTSLQLPLAGSENCSLFGAPSKCSEFVFSDDLKSNGNDHTLQRTKIIPQCSFHKGKCAWQVAQQGKLLHMNM